MSKVIATCRARNEARNIDRFCQSYQWADAVLVADGGSEDDTVERASKYSNVAVRAFAERVENNGYWRNPHGRHINFLIDWAIDEGADWIIFDDCDCVPTWNLQQNIRGILASTCEQVIELYRLYVWGTGQYFSEMNRPGTSIWAWHRDAGIRADESNPLVHRIGEWSSALRLQPPYACLHYTWPDEAEVERKMDFYTNLREIEVMHPLKCRGALETLPEWARWK